MPTKITGLKVPPERLERPTPALGRRCSIQLNYGGLTKILTQAVNGANWRYRFVCFRCQCKLLNHYQPSLSIYLVGVGDPLLYHSGVKQEKEAMKREIRVLLDEDTAQFLEMAGGAQSNAAISDFINSLLRQERFRQGFPPYFKKPRLMKTSRSWQEKWRIMCRQFLSLSTQSRY